MLLPKYPLAFLPTPLHHLPGLSQTLPYDIYIKRDDQTGLATGGNKTRKLEYLIKEALNTGYDTVITAGAQQSNHCRQTAAACASAGLECHLWLNGNEPETYQGNLLLSHLLGAHLHFSGEKAKGRELALQELKKKLDAQGKKTYIIPVGGSNLTGALGYVAAMAELKEQMTEQQISFDYIFFATSSGGTQAGIMIGSKLFDIKAELMPILIDKTSDFEVPLQQTIHDIITAYNQNSSQPVNIYLDDIPVIETYNSAGYGVITDNERRAIKTLAQTEGILVDPVYTGRAFYGMLNMLENNDLPKNSKVLFWHTGGTPALCAYTGDLK